MIALISTPEVYDLNCHDISSDLLVVDGRPYIFKTEEVRYREDHFEYFFTFL